MPDKLEKLRKVPGIVRLHGHRGARGVWPENTMVGFQNTFDLGVQVIELDVLLTKDNIPVITHNPRLMAETTRGADGVWLTQDGPKIFDLTYAQLCSYDVGAIRAGSDYAQRYPEQESMTGQSIPRLEDLARLAVHPRYGDVWLNIEIKSTPIEAGLTPPPQLLASQVVDVIQRNGLSDRVIVQSFDWRVLGHIERLAPNLPRSHLTRLARTNPKLDANIYSQSPWMAGAKTSGLHEKLCQVVLDAGGQFWAPFHEDVVASQVARAQDIGLIVNAWTVNAIKDIDRMIDAGVDGIITDYPCRVQQRLVTRGLHWREDYTQISG